MAETQSRLQNVLSDRYRIERELGRGGMATVFLAQDLKHHRSVAIKVLNPELAAAIGSERFLREIETSARLNHPQILPLHDSGVADGLLYYVMPYVEGESLRERLLRERQLPLEDALRITHEVADALDYAHSQGVVHRDIKPENILVSRGHAVVADFGIARVNRMAGGEKLTETGLMVGSPLYMSPEQVTGDPHIDGRSDQYSLACVVYEMLAGQTPFTGATTESVVHQHLSVEPRSVAELRPAVPAGIAQALGRSLAKTPADRFETVAQLAAALVHRESANLPVPPPVASARAAHRTWRLALLGGAAVIVVVGALLLLRPGRQVPVPAPEHARTAIAVLPFLNLSAEGSHEYFAGGLHDELLTQLAKVAALKVISRTSVMGYQGTSMPPLRQIASELGVGSVVEGSVQVVDERLRVNVQLIDAATDEHLWAERYDRTLDDAFVIQSEVAQQIVVAVGAALTSVEQGSLTASPTANAEAYRLYLQGREYWTRPGWLRQNQEAAQQFYERALGLDPQFALAHAALSQVHGAMYWTRSDPSAIRAARQREAAEAALRLAPDLPQAHAAMGLVHYWGNRDYRRALAEFDLATKGLPNNAEAWKWIGAVHRRLGNWKEALEAYQKAVQLEPRNADLSRDFAATYHFMHRYPDAVRHYERALTLAPDLHSAAIARGWTYFEWQGKFDSLRAILNRLPRETELDVESVDAERAALLFWERDAEGLLEMLRVARADVFERPGSDALYAAWAHQMRGNHAAAQMSFESARVRLDSAMRALPDAWVLHADRGMVLAGLGRRNEALREARWLEQSVNYREDALDGPAVAANRALIFAHLGDAHAALDEIEPILEGPSWVNIHSLRLDPLWDPIRDHPRFKALLSKHGFRTTH